MEPFQWVDVRNPRRNTMRLPLPVLSFVLAVVAGVGLVDLVLM